MDNYLDSKELQEMKEQLAILTQKLNKEAIVNERLIRQSIKKDVLKTQRHSFIKAIVIAFCIPFTIWNFHQIGTSLWLCAFTTFFLGLALTYDYFTHRNLRSNEAMQGNLIEVRKKVVSIKQAYKNWLKIGIPFIILWCPWFLYEVSLQTHIPQEAIVLGFASGVIIGGAIGIREYLKLQRTTDEILQQINDITKNE